MNGQEFELRKGLKNVFEIIKLILGIQKYFLAMKVF